MRKGNFIAGLGIIAVGLPAWRQLTLLGMDITAVYQWKNAFSLLFEGFNAETIGSVLMMSLLWASFTGLVGTIVFVMGFRPEKPPVPEIKYDSTKARLFARKIKDARWEDAPEPVAPSPRMNGGSIVEFDASEESAPRAEIEEGASSPVRKPGKNAGHRVALRGMGGVGAKVLNFFSGALSGAGSLAVVASRAVGPVVMDWVDIVRARIGEIRGNRTPVVRDPNVSAFGRKSENENEAYAATVLSWYAAYMDNRDMTKREAFREEGRALAAKLTEERREHILQNYSMRGFAALSAITSLLPKKTGAARQPEIGELIGGDEPHGASPMVQPAISELLDRVEAEPLDIDEGEDYPEEAVQDDAVGSADDEEDDPNPFADSADSYVRKTATESPSSNGGLFGEQGGESEDETSVTGIRIAPRANGGQEEMADDGDAFSSGLLGDFEGSGPSGVMGLAGLVDEKVSDDASGFLGDYPGGGADGEGDVTTEDEASGPVDIPDDIEEAAARFRSSSPEEAERIYHEDNAARHLFESIYAAPKEEAASAEVRKEPTIVPEEPAVEFPASPDMAGMAEGVDAETGSGTEEDDGDEYTRLAGRWMSEDGEGDDADGEDEEAFPSAVVLPEAPQTDLDGDASSEDDNVRPLFDGIESSGGAVPSDAEMERAIAGMDKSRFAAILGEKKGSPAWVKRKLTEYGLEDIGDRSGLIPVLWEQLDKAVDYQTRAFAWENFGETPPPELASSGDRERYLIKVATSILALKEQVSEETLTRIGEIKRGSEEVAWLNGRAERMLAALSSPENRDRLRNLVNRDTGVLRPLHESRTFGHMTGRGEPDGYRFLETLPEDDQRRFASVASEYRHVVDRDIKVYKDIQVTHPGLAGQRDAETVVMNIVVGEVKEAGVPLVGIALVRVPQGKWRLVPNELGGRDSWSLIGEGENNGIAIRMRDHDVSAFREWADKKNRSPVYALVQLVLEEGAAVFDLDKITDPEVRIKVWSQDEWSVVKRFHLSKKAS